MEANGIKNQIIWLVEMTRLNFRSLLEYRTALFLQAVGMIINNGALIGVWYTFFEIFKSVNGWTFREMLGLHGFTAIVYGLVFTFAFGVRRISRSISYGQMDKYLLLPKSPLLNIMFSETSFSAVGDMIFGVICMAAYIVMIGFQPVFLISIPLLIIAATIIFTGFTVIAQSVAFWFPNSEDLSDALFEFMLGPSLNPNSAFTGIIRFFFTFFVPAILIGGLPVDIMLYMRPADILILFALSIVWFTLASLVFYGGLKRYESGNLVGNR